MDDGRWTELRVATVLGPPSPVLDPFPMLTIAPLYASILPTSGYALNASVWAERPAGRYYPCLDKRAVPAEGDHIYVVSASTPWLKRRHAA